MTDAKAERLVAAMTNSFPIAIIRSSPELQAGLTNHPKVRHVLAAAIARKSALIVTPNLRDFDEDALSPFSLRAVSPDDFLLTLLDRDAETVQDVIDLQRMALRNPPMTRDQVLDSLALFAPEFAEAERKTRQ